MARRSRGEIDPLAEFMNRPVRVHPAVRVALALVVLLGGALILFLGAALIFLALRRPVPHPIGASIVGMLVIAMGGSFVHVGSRFLRARSGTPVVLGARATTIIGLLFGAAAVGMMITAWRADGIMPAVNALAVGVLSFLILRSGASDEDR